MREQQVRGGKGGGREPGLWGPCGLWASTWSELRAIGGWSRSPCDLRCQMLTVAVD